eukprot:302799-Pleurochrysis_carterae.AAC.1
MCLPQHVRVSVCARVRACVLVRSQRPDVAMQVPKRLSVLIPPFGNVGTLGACAAKQGDFSAEERSQMSV